MLGTHMRLKHPVAFPFVVQFYFSKSVAGGYFGRIEFPRAFGTSPAHEALPLNPHHLWVRCEGLAAWDGHHTSPFVTFGL